MDHMSHQLGNPSHVLMVEDEALISEMVAEVLTGHGFNVHTVPNAGAALRHLISGAPCDVLFTDINLRGSVDGSVLARLVRALRPDLPVVYASGSIAGLHELSAVKGSTFVPKPYDPFKVASILVRCTQTPPAVAAAMAVNERPVTLA